MTDKGIRDNKGYNTYADSQKSWYWFGEVHEKMRYVRTYFCT